MAPLSIWSQYVPGSEPLLFACVSNSVSGYYPILPVGRDSDPDRNPDFETRGPVMPETPPDVAAALDRLKNELDVWQGPTLRTHPERRALARALSAGPNLQDL